VFGNGRYQDDEAPGPFGRAKVVVRWSDPPSSLVHEIIVSDLIQAATRSSNMEVVREHMYEMDSEAVANIPISHVAQP
jgi:hypothetical protein